MFYTLLRSLQTVIDGKKTVIGCSLLLYINSKLSYYQRNKYETKRN